ncbi:haloacid dehalogenase [Apiospora phragmitis]|uniref:Haloacid dehalogenase n=1 Tax=Apiospora phragmitis TaxID=2905665 RepID=A0ABR1VFU8_9PEZI
MMTEAATVPLPALQGVQALLFDVFGTVVDWRSTVVAELTRRGREKADSPAFDSLAPSLQSRLAELIDADWATFAQQWRASYGKFTKGFVPGEMAWKDIDTHHYDSLIELLGDWGLAGAFNDDDVRSLSRIWHYLQPWEDSAQGLKMLGTRYTTSTLSNGNQQLLQDLNEHGQLGFHRLISSADFKAYKPDPKTYLGAVDALGRQPGECAMVAAHLGDLKAARSCGLRTVYIERPREEDWASRPDLIEDARAWVDVWVASDQDGFVEVARRLGIPGVRDEYRSCLADIYRDHNAVLPCSVGGGGGKYFWLVQASRVGEGS